MAFKKDAPEIEKIKELRPTFYVREAAAYLGVSMPTMYEILPDLETYQVRGRLRVMKASLDAYLTKNPVGKVAREKAGWIDNKPPAKAAKKASAR